MCTVTITSSKGTKAQFSHNAGGDVPTFFTWYIYIHIIYLVYKDDQRAASAGDPPQPHNPGFGILRSVCS